MSLEERLETVRAAIRESRAEVAQADQRLSVMGHEFVQLEDEVRKLRSDFAKTAPQFFTEDELADLLKVSPSTIERLRKGGRIPHLKLGVLVRYSAAHVDEIAKALEKPATAKSRISLVGRKSA